MNYQFTSHRNIQIVIALLKKNGIKRVVTSPGVTDMAINFSLQHDNFFELYSCVDERSAAYMACGMAAETGEPVVLTCTGATSSRNYMPGMTEAYYRHLPVLAITCSQPSSRIGHYFNQVTDRNHLPTDVAEESVCAQVIVSPDDEWDVTVKVNKAIIGLRRNGGGPCHINLEIGDGGNFYCKSIPPARSIDLVAKNPQMPPIMFEKVAVFVGQHSVWSKELTALVDRFCEIYNAIVICDQTSNYKGKYGVLISLINDQAEEKYNTRPPEIDLIIHIGYVSNVMIRGKEVWRINEDGQIRDTFHKLRKVFQMTELDFFTHYAGANSETKDTSFYKDYNGRYEHLLNSIPELPFSNLWVAQMIAGRFPENSVLHLGIRNSLRSYEYFRIPQTVSVYSNTGGFGIDGGVSSLIGASLIHPEKLYFGVFGELLFFYDMNSIGNRHIQNNLRIIIVNNGLGQEFKNYSCSSSAFGSETDAFIAAKGHFGCQSRQLIKGYAETLGFEYMCANDKEEFLSVCDRFLTPDNLTRPILLELFTNTSDEDEALQRVTLISNKSKFLKSAKRIIDRPEMVKAKDLIKKIAGK